MAISVDLLSSFLIELYIIYATDERQKYYMDHLYMEIIHNKKQRNNAQFLRR